MPCTAPRLFRHRQTHQYWLASCMRWTCTTCIRRVASRWRAILHWASQHGPGPEYFLTLTLREPLPLWRQAPAEQQAHPTNPPQSGWYLTTDLYDGNIHSMKALHLEHLTEARPDLLPLIGLPFGYRFEVTASGESDIWFDPDVAASDII